MKHQAFGMAVRAPVRFALRALSYAMRLTQITTWRHCVNSFWVELFRIYNEELTNSDQIRLVATSASYQDLNMVSLTISAFAELRDQTIRP
jgi:uncharacterized surface protein with fasciclin (FAS1) repeats